ncbi:hypothetical protein DPM19_29525 [Actinomadura craniellae]|uniref:Uncharacterized protein n=1 Tax=Actinomadura craniellae TaxID=2231787 RepID=A0A365GXC8_9ACTN|nr:hypothetical protein [Actinomadura craniellae]RAY11452.1 hypothetical protein DPM19_29525 [Actinomadura craniellae]
MTPPQDPIEDPRQIIAHLLDPRPRPATPWPAPPGTPGSGSGTVAYRRDELLKVAKAMRQDLQELKTALSTLQGGSPAGGRVGGWDVAKQLGTKVDGSHRNLVTGMQRYCQVYEAAIRRIEQAAANYARAELASTDINRRVGQSPGLSDTPPW